MLQTTQNQKNIVGGLSLLFAAFLYGINGGVLARSIGINFGVFYHAFMRNLLLAIIALLITILWRQWKAMDKRDYRWFLILGVFGVLTTGTFFVAFNMLPIGMALLFFYASATLSSSAIGFLFFKERISPQWMGAMCISLAGLILIFYETLQFSHVIFIAIACMAGFFEAIWNIFSKKISSRYALSQILAVDSFIASTIALVIIFLTGSKMHAPALTIPWIAISASALVTFGGSYCVIGGYRYIEAHRGSIILLAEVVFGILFAYFLFGEALSILSIIGGCLIAAGIILMNLQGKSG